MAVEIEPALRRTQHERRTATRAALLSAAANRIVEGGPGTGIAEIARSAGVSKGALQHHFDAKADLFVAVASAGWGDLADRIAEPPRATVQVGDRLRWVVAATWESYRQPMCRAAFIISSDPSLDRELGQRLHPIFEAARIRLDRVWVEAFADLGVTVEQLRQARRFVRSHLLGMLAQRHLPSEEPEPDDEIDALCVAALQIVAPSS